MGIWLIKYGLQQEEQEEYLDWFHDIHIAEKLARPGYTWASHYRIKSRDSDDSEGPEYMALFGGTSSRVFYDPSPLQIKPNQDELTRKMMGYRVKPHMQILSREWTESDDDSATATAIQSAGIVFWLFGQASVADQHKPDIDQVISSWCTQQFFKSQLQSPTTSAMHKLLASTGSPRHVVLQELLANGLQDDKNNKLQTTFDSWAGTNTDTTLTAVQAERCWPAQH